MLTAVVTRGVAIEVSFVATAGAEDHHLECDDPEEIEGEVVCGEGPSPIAPELKELAWGAGSFVVLALLMRFILFPRIKKGMDARYSLIRQGHESADQTRDAAKAEVADYEAALAAVKAEANDRVEAARRTLEAERAARLAEVNAEVAASRDEAIARTRAARDAAEADVAAAVADVASRTVELATGRVPDASAVQAAVAEAMGVGVAS